MEVMVILVPLALALGLIGLVGFLWSLKSGQYDDLEGAGWRAISDDDVGRESPAPRSLIRTLDQKIDSYAGDQDKQQYRRQELGPVNALRPVAKYELGQ
jgi:cbb3-type cytochrome oxidase maturation protein